MTGLPSGSEATLVPVREGLKNSSQVKAADIRKRAHDQAVSIMAAAKTQADQIRATAVSDGEAAAKSEAAIRSARVRRKAHEVELASQNSLLLELQRQVHESAVALKDDPRYPHLLVQLRKESRALLGKGTKITKSSEGGIIAVQGSRRLDLTLSVLAARRLETMLPQISAIWSSR